MADVHSSQHAGEPPGGAPVIVCATCGDTPDEVGLAQLTWTRGTENGREIWTCATCSRRHLRSIEGKLDSSWW